MMKKILITVLAVLFAFALFAGCIAQNAEPKQTETITPPPSVPVTPETTPEPTQEPDAGPQEENTDDNDMPTISSLGIDQGNYTDEDEGFFLNIQSTAWGGADKDVIYCRFTLYDTEFGVKILYPEKIYEVHFDDETWYQYDAANKEVVDPWFDVDAKLEKIAGDHAAGLNEEIVKYIDDYCISTFGFMPEELIMLMYE